MSAKEEDFVDFKDMDGWSQDFVKNSMYLVKYLDEKVKVKLDDGTDAIRVNAEDVFPKADSDNCKPEFLPLVRAASKATWMKRRRDMKSLTLEKPLGSRPKGVSSETAKTFVNEFVPMIWAELEGKGKMKQLRARFKSMLQGNEGESEDKDIKSIFKIGEEVNVRTYNPDGRVPKVKFCKATFQGSAPPVDLRPCLGKYKYDASINSRVCLYRGDISAINVDAIQNAANRGLNRGGGVCGAIHKRAGPSLQEECMRLPCKDEAKEEKDRVRCPVGETRLTKGFDLPAKYVLHSVGPQNGVDVVGLRNAYQSALDLGAKNADISSIALCCLSTGIFGFPLESAAHVAIGTVREWLEKNSCKTMEKVVFCVFGEKDQAIYFELMRHYFPTDE